MAYQELRKLFYGNAEQYRQEYLRRFQGENTVRLAFTIGEHPAFFEETNEILRLMLSIERRNASVQALCRELPRVALSQYSQKCLIDEIVLTNKVEGVHSSRKEISDALTLLGEQSQAKGKTLRFQGLVKKYLTLRFGDTLPLDSCEAIRRIYDELVLPEILADDPANAPDGRLFRKQPTFIHGSTDRVIHKGLMPEERIEEALRQALDFLHDERIEPLYRICVFHYLLEYIHPFYDGNGRLGRFLVSYCIAQTLEPLLAYRISGTVKEHINRYYKAFDTCNDPHSMGDVTPFLHMMLQMIDTACGELQESLTQRMCAWQKYEQLLPQLEGYTQSKMSELYSYLTQAALFSENGISTQELMEHLGVSYSTVKKLLNQVTQIKGQTLLLSEKQGQAKYYQLNLPVLERLL